jgi:LuxR family maltose regulon positive regulatory protein
MVVSMTTATAALNPEASFDGLVQRPRLVDRLSDLAGPPLALVAAPAGYGKTTLLAEWALDDPRPVAWITLEDWHNDPRLLTAELERALDVPGPCGLALDDVHVLRTPEALAVLRELTGRLPAGCRVVLGTRTEPDLPIARLRAHRALVEIRAPELAMTADEAGTLLTMAGVELPRAAVETLLRRTEGWPAGLYLAALSVREQHRAPDAVERFGGDDAAVADYLREVVLSELGSDAVSFLSHTAVLDRLSAPLCDAVLGGSGAGAMLDDLAATRLLLIPLDRQRRWYRLHPLLSQMLRSELSRREPAAERDLRRRAAKWFAAAGDTERAIAQATAAGATDLAAELIGAAAAEYVAKGRNHTVRSWLGEIGEGAIAADPCLALCAAGSDLVLGDVDGVQRWESAARRGLLEHRAGSSAGAVGAGVTLMRAAVAGDGLEQMRRDAVQAAELAPADSPARSLCCLLEAVALHLTGDRARAETVLEEGVHRGAVVAPNILTLCLAQLSIMAAERDDWGSAAALNERARHQVDHYSLHLYPTSALVFAASAAVRARLGQVEPAQADARQARRLLETMGDFAPWYDAETRVALARAALRLGDLPASRELLAGATRRARRLPEALALHDWIADLSRQTDAVSAAALPGPATLTTAELRILGFLPTHLSFREIAARLYVSANTVKTQAHAVYRKLDASSRSQAVARATALGLIEA